MRWSIVVFAVLSACGGSSSDGVVPGIEDAEPACAREDCQCTVESDCLAHAGCDLDRGECVCVAGYEKVGQFCIFEGLQDPDLNGEPAAWQIDGAATIEADSTTDGLADPGEAVWTRIPLNQLSALSQALTMPPLEKAEPFVAVVRQKIVTPSAALVYIWLAPSAMIQIGNQTSRLPVQWFGWEDHRVCLGESVYGRDVEVRVAPSNPQRGLSGYTLEVDSVQIEPAAQDECPAIGEVIDGDFESGAWIARGGGDVRAELGLGGSNAGYLETSNCGQLASLTTTVSIPESRGGQAVRFAWRASAEASAELGLGLPEFPEYGLVANIREVSPFASVSGPVPTLQVSEACIPPHLLGTVAPLTFTLHKEAFANACSQTRTFVVDDVSIVDAPNCPSAGVFADPSFEAVQNALVTGWAVTHDAGRSPVPTLVGSSDAVDGAYVMRLSSTPENTNCRPVEVSSSFRYPAIAEGQRPAIRVRYRFSDTTSTQAYFEAWRPRDLWSSGQLPWFSADDGTGVLVQGWQTATVCGETYDAGRTDDVRLSFSPAECDPVVPQYLDVDLVEAVAVPQAECAQ